MKEIQRRLKIQKVKDITNINEMKIFVKNQKKTKKLEAPDGEKYVMLVMNNGKRK